MSIPVARLRAAIANKLGFVDASSGRGPHTKYRLYVDGVWVAQTQVPRGSKPVGDKLAGMIARQLRISSTELHQLADCTLSRDAYLAKVL